MPMWDHEAIRSGSIPMSGDELCTIIASSKSPPDAAAAAVVRAKNSGLDELTTMAHGMRVFAVIEFIAEQKDRLYEAGLLYPQDAEGDIISQHLLHVLAGSPYTHVRDEGGPEGKPHLGFDPDDVIIEAGRRLQADEQDGNESV